VSDVNANIGIHFDTANALAELRKLQAGLSRFNQSLTEGNIAAANAQKGLNAQLLQAINATGKFVASQKTITSGTAAFTEALEKNKLSMGQYFKFTAAAATINNRNLKNLFAQEKDILNRAMKDRVKSIQTQYIQLTNANGELVKVLQIVPKHLQMVNGQYADYATRVQMAAQRQQFLNQLIKQGSTQLLNFGKNTQWAGRQLMVGLTIPLSILGTTAAQTFREMEMAVVNFTRVYGDMTTSNDATNKAVADIQKLAKEFTKFGIAATDTVNMAAKAAAMGLTGSALTAQVEQATKLAVLGQVDQQSALQTTISLQNAFGISSDQLASKINYLNAVENQTVLSIEDMTTAIPKAAPVVKQLGGSVEDLAFFLTAMKEGGINASEAANALKSSLASIINPSKNAKEMLAGLGINISSIVDSNAGNLKGTVIGLAKALDTLAPLDRSRAIEQLFGKFQFARISTMFQNITKSSSQASTALGLAGASVEELAILSQREMNKVENAVGVKFQKQIEQLKLQLIPIGKIFLQAVTPIVQFAGSILEKFNNLSDGTKKFVVGLIAILGGIAPVALMTVGLVANGVANLIKFFGILRGGIARLNGQNNVLGGGFEYLTQAETDNLGQSQALHGAHQDLISTFDVEATSVGLLATAYKNAASQARALASGSPGLFNSVPGPTGAVSGISKYAGGKNSDIVTVGGTGNQDTELALLTPGETVVSAPMSKKYGSLINAMNADNIKKYAGGKDSDFWDQNKIAEFLEKIGIGSDARVRIPLAVREKNYSVAGIMAPWEVNHGKNAAGEKGMDPLYAQSELGRDALDANLQAGLEAAGVETQRIEKILKDLESTLDEAVVQYDGTTKSWKIASDRAIKSINSRTDLTDKEKQIIQQRVAPQNVDDYIISSNPVLEVKPAKNGKPGAANIRDERTKTQYYDRRQAEILKQKHPELADEINDMEFSHMPGSEYMYGEISKAEAPTANRRPVNPDGSPVMTTNSKGKQTPLVEKIKFNEQELSDISAMREQVEAHKLSLQDEEMIKQSAAKTTDAVIEQIKTTAQTKSPSRRTRKIGRDIVDGLKVGMEDGQADVASQSSRLADAAIPKIDKANKAKYDALKDDPEQRQILKSQERQKRKLSAIKQNNGTSSLEVEADKYREQQDAAVRVTADEAKKAAKEAAKARKAQEDVVRATRAAAKAQEKNAESIKQSSVSTIEAENIFSQANQQIIESKLEQSQAAEEAAYSAKESVTDLITENELQQQILANKQNSVNSSDSINQIENDIANSEISIAKAEMQIEENKRRMAQRGMQEVAASANVPIIPTGSQTANKFINPTTALGYKEAYDEASSYTKNKNGQLLMDPETGEPTTLTAKQINQKKRGMRREAVGRYSGRMAGALGTATMVAGMAGAPAGATAALGSAAMVAQFAPMIAGLSGPQGLAVGLAAAAVAVFKLRSEFDATRSATMKLAKSIGPSTDAIRQLSISANRVSAGEEMDKKRKDSLSPYNIQSGKSTFGEQFLQSDTGKATLQNLQGLMVKDGKKIAGGSDQAAKTLTSQLMAAVSSGALTKAQADSIAANMAVKLGDAGLGIKISAKLDNVFGPNGENLLKDPLKVRLKVMQDQQNVANKSMETLNKNKGSGFMASRTGQIGSVAAMTGIGAGAGALIGSAILPGVGTAVGAVVGSIAGAVGGYFANRANNKKMAAMAGATVASQQMALEQNKEQLDSLDLYYSKKVEELKIQGKIVEAEKAQTEWTNARNKLVKEAAGYNKNIVDQYNKAGSNQEALLSGAKSAAKDKYKGTDSAAFVEAAQNVLGQARKSGGLNSGQEYLLNLKVASGDLDPQQVLNLIDPSNNKKTKLVMDIVTNFGATTANQVSQIANTFTDMKGNPVPELQTKFIATVAAAKTDKEAQDIMNLYNDVSKGSGIYSADVAISFIDGNKTIREQLIKDFAAIDDAVNTGKEISVIYNIDTKMKGNVDEAYFNKLSKNDKVRYLKTVETLVNMPEAQITGDDSYKKWLDEPGPYGGKDWITKESVPALIQRYIKDMAYDVTQAKDTSSSINTGGNTGNGGSRDTTFDDITKRLRNLRLAAIDASKGFNELQRAIANTGSKAIKNQFNGLEQQLIKLGKATQFTDYLAGLDQKELNKMGKTATKKGIDPNTGKKKKGVKVGDFVLSKTGETMEKGYNKAIIGDYNAEQLKAITLSKQEVIARTKLTALGYDQVDIEKMLSNENYKTLIATGKITDQELSTNAALTQQARLRGQMDAIFRQSGSQRDMNAAEAANKALDAYKSVDEHTIKNKEGNTYSAIQVRMDALNNQAKIAQDEINLTQSKIDTMQQEIDKDQRDIETKFTRPIEQKQRSIDKLNKTAEINFVRPIQALQDKSSILSHDLDVMSHAADQINAKYDAQQEALTKVAEINQRIIDQQQQQLGLADALSQGDIAAAAKAAQEMRASNASAYASSAQDALAQARQNEINGLRGGVSGLSQKDIQEQQYQINQQIYTLEQGKAEIDKQILAIQDEIYTLEQSRQVALDAIQVKADAIAKIQNGALLDQQNALKAINDQNLQLQLQSDQLAQIIANNDANRIVSGHTREEWDNIAAAAKATEELASGDLARAIAGFSDTSGTAADAWKTIKDKYDGIIDKSISIKQYIETIYAPMPEQSASTSMDIVARLRQQNGGYLSMGGIVPKYFAVGGYAKGTDTVPAMLTPGEFVMSRYAVNNHGVDTMKALNSGAGIGDSVYNYNLNVSVKSDANPDDIARTVMAQIRQIDSQRIRGVRV
jgi:hypothetical protein